MDKIDQLRCAIDNILISGYPHETKIEQLINAMKQHQDILDVVVIGWLDVRVKAPDIGVWIDIKYSNGTEAYHRMCTEKLLLHLRQVSAQWKPYYL